MKTPISRRDFVKMAGIAGLGLAAGPRFLMNPALAADGGRTPVLVHVFQRGGMDGLSATRKITCHTSN